MGGLGWYELPVPEGVQEGTGWILGDVVEGISASSGVAGRWQESFPAQRLYESIILGE